ncbi:MAG: hypothetical protein ACREMY_07375, partial [bacterium]
DLYFPNGSFDGAHTVTADVSDHAGNPAAEASKPLTVDETPPAQPLVTDLVLSDDGSGGTRLALDGGIDADTTIAVADGSGPLGTPNAGAGGWDDTIDPLASGDHMIAITASDEAQNTASANFEVNLVDSTHVTIDLTNVGTGVPDVDTTGLPTGTNVTVNGSSTGGDGIVTGDGADNITTHGGSTVLAGAGSDVLNGGADETFYGEAGNDTITFSGSGSAAGYHGDYDPSANSTDRDYSLERTGADTWVVTALTGAGHTETDLGTDNVTGADVLQFDGNGAALATADLISLISDSDNSTDTVAEGATATTYTGLDAVAASQDGTVSYSLTDNAGGRFAIDGSGNVTVTAFGASRIDYESSGGSYDITVKALSTDGSFTTQDFTIAVTDAAPSVPVDSDNTNANTVVEGAASGTYTGLTASSTDVNGGAVTYSLIGDTSGGGFAVDASGAVKIADALKVDFGGDSDDAAATVHYQWQSSDGGSFSAGHVVPIGSDSATYLVT